MVTLIRSTALLLAFFLAGTAAQADSDAQKYSDAKQVFQDAGQSGSFFAKSYGYALFPSVGKGGMGIGGAHGKGRVYAGNSHVGNTSMTQLTMGLQLGGQVYSQIIFFQDRRAFDEFTSGNFEFGAQATAVAITAGVSASADTGGGTSAGASGGKSDATTVHGGFRKGMAIFTVAKGGLMYEATVGGQKFKYKAI
jgi:lipid-binding SYLF domain-containing protein